MYVGDRTIKTSTVISATLDLLLLRYFDGVVLGELLDVREELPVNR